MMLDRPRRMKTTLVIRDTMGAALYRQQMSFLVPANETTLVFPIQMAGMPGRLMVELELATDAPEATEEREYMMDRPMMTVDEGSALLGKIAEEMQMNPDESIGHYLVRQTGLPSEILEMVIHECLAMPPEEAVVYALADGFLLGKETYDRD